MSVKALTGLYVITDDSHTSTEMLVSQVEQALQGNARVVQYRNKHALTTQRLEEAGALLELCRRFQAPLIINDDIELAVHTGADGVHLGRDDGRVADARKRLGQQGIIGVSCYNSIDRARKAANEGADYVAFGRFYASGSKPEASPASIETLHQAKRLIKLPIVAIGGINAENSPPLLSAGADMLAVIGGVFRQPDIREASRAIANLFSGEHT